MPVLHLFDIRMQTIAFEAYHPVPPLQELSSPIICLLCDLFSGKIDARKRMQIREYSSSDREVFK